MQNPDTRLACRLARLNFWIHWLGPDCPNPKERARRLKPGRPLPDWLAAGLPKNKERVRVLDVNAGPLSALGTRAPGHKVELVPIDTLAHDFDALLRRHSITPPVKTRFFAPEDVLATFGKGAFDVVFSYNGIDFSEDPVAVYRQLLQCLAPGGRILTLHEPFATFEQLHGEPFRHFHGLREGRAVIQRKTLRRDLQDALPGARVVAKFEDNCVKVDIRRSQRPARTLLPPPCRKGGPLPELISVHIPKTAGTSFRLFLQELYGGQLRCLYAEEETAPELAPVFEFAPETCCLHGHIQASAFSDKFPRASYLTWLRDPVERIASSYFQYLREPGLGLEQPVNQRLQKEGWSLLEFARTPEMRGQQAWYVDALPRERFLFIGITERYAESLRLLCHLLGVAAPKTIPTVNTNPEKNPRHRYILTRHQREELEILYAEDIELYRYAKRRLDRQLRQAFGS